MRQRNMWSSSPFSYSSSCALSSMKYTTSQKNAGMLKTGISPFCSFESVFSLTPVQKVALYCLVPSTALLQAEDMPHFRPWFCSLCPQNHDPESLGTGVSPWLVHTTGKPFPHPKNYLPSTNLDPFVSPYSPCIHTERKTKHVENPHTSCESWTMPIQAPPVWAFAKIPAPTSYPGWNGWNTARKEETI